MQLWRAGDQTKVGKYLDKHGLRRDTLFIQLLQGLIELAPADSEERSTLEVLSNYIDPNQEIAPRRQGGTRLRPHCLKSVQMAAPILEGPMARLDRITQDADIMGGRALSGVCV